MPAPMPARPLALTVVLLTLVAAGCVTPPEPTPATNTTTPTSVPDETMAPMDVTVTVGEGLTPGAPPEIYTLSPKKLELHVGMPVNLTLKNTGMNQHDLVIEGIEGAKIAAIGAGESKSVTFTPTEAGDFPMYCTIGTEPVSDHRGHGMSGTVTVVA